jgi:serine-type D-Ala-D-Ala carboxypeptidase (penicillin-binding protein 5/6)
MNLLNAATIAAALAALPVEAAAPPFQTAAPVAFMKDLSSGAILFARDADRRMPPASMAKMMTVYVAFDLIKKGELKLDQRLTVRPETWQRWHGPAAGSTMFLSVGEQVSVDDLLSGIVTLSGNDACVVLAEGISGTEPAFVALMNQRAKAIGLANSNFGNSNGWPDGGATYVTARDLATLAERTIRDFPDLYKRFYSKPNFTWGKTMGAGAAITQANRDPLLGRVEGADGLKTGHTDEAGYGFTGSAEQGGRRLVMVVAGLGSFNQRISESVAFMDWGFRAWRSKAIVRKGTTVQTAEVQGGDADEVSLVAPRDIAVTVPAGLGQEMRTAVSYRGPLQAPVKAGSRVADLVVSVPGMPVQRLPLVAAVDVEEAGFFRRIWQGLAHLTGLA